METLHQRHCLARNSRTVIYVASALLLAWCLLAPEHAFAAEGNGGSLPYESWLTNLRNSVMSNPYA